MPYFLAVYTIKPEAVARFRAMPKSEQDAIDARGLALWQDWEQRNAAALVNKGGMVGKTMQVTTSGIAPAINDFCGYVVVEADNAESAAQLFIDHPHIGVFPGHSVDIMPFLAGPDI